MWYVPVLSPHIKKSLPVGKGLCVTATCVPICFCFKLSDSKQFHIHKSLWISAASLCWCMCLFQSFSVPEQVNDDRSLQITAAPHQEKTFEMGWNTYRLFYKHVDAVVNCSKLSSETDKRSSLVYYYTIWLTRLFSGLFGPCLVWWIYHIDFRLNSWRDHVTSVPSMPGNDEWIVYLAKVDLSFQAEEDHNRQCSMCRLIWWITPPTPSPSIKFEWMLTDSIVPLFVIIYTSVFFSGHGFSGFLCTM